MAPSSAEMVDEQAAEDRAAGDRDLEGRDDEPARRLRLIGRGADDPGLDAHRDRAEGEALEGDANGRNTAATHRRASAPAPSPRSAARPKMTEALALRADDRRPDEIAEEAADARGEQDERDRLDRQHRNLLQERTDIGKTGEMPGNAQQDA